jgi:tetratricopeptide (TPR) repeat protein
LRPTAAPEPYNLGVTRFLIKRAWIGLLIAAGLLLLPNALIGRLVPTGGVPTPTMAPTPDPRDDAWAQALALAGSDPLAALPYLDEVLFSSHPTAERARVLAQGISAGRVVDDEAYLFTATGQALGAIHEWEKAREALLLAVQLDPEYAEAWAYLGEAQFQNGQDSYEALQHALELNPNSLAVQLFNALYWQREEDFEQANLHFYVAAQLAPEDPSIQIQWGQNSILRGDPVGASEHFEAAAALTPEDPAVWKAMARYSIDTEVLVAELGFPAALQLVTDSPNDLQALVLLGRAHLLMGNDHSGVGFLERALELDEEYAPAHLHLGIYLLDQGFREEAMTHLNAVIAFAPGTPEAEWARELIVQMSQ